MNSDDDLAAVALLAEPLRLELYRYVRAQHRAVGRAEAAEATGISVKLAAFHLDRLGEAEMLEAGYQRISGRTGPGAGRPAKVYSFSKQRFAVSLPQTGYLLAASIMATALSGEYDGMKSAAAVEQVAASAGQRLGVEMSRGAKTDGARLRALFRGLDDLGFEPKQDGPEMVLCNCIFADLTQGHRDVICGLNGALLGGLLEGMDLRYLRIEGKPPGTGCCAGIVTGSAS